MLKCSFPGKTLESTKIMWNKSHYYKNWYAMAKNGKKEKNILKAL